jgi:hypothetical protein
MVIYDRNMWHVSLVNKKTEFIDQLMLSVVYLCKNT